MARGITTDPAVVGQREDAIGQAAGQQGGNRQAALDAIATGGRAGRQAYRDGRSSVNAARNQAMQGMASDAYGLFAQPDSAITQDTQQLGGETYDAYRGALGRLGQAFGRNMDAQGTLNSNYFGQIAASAPAYRQMANEQIDEARRQWLAQKAAHDAAESTTGDMSKWEIEANATGLGERMAGQAVQGSREAMAEAINRAIAQGRARGERGEGPTFRQYMRAADANEATGAGWTGEGQAPVRRAQRDAIQTIETPEWAWQRAAADAMGVPEALSAGLFTPPDAGDIVNQAQERRQLEFLNGSGGGQFESPQAMRDYQTAVDTLNAPPDPLPASVAADQMGLPPDEAAALMSHPAFGDAVDTFAQGVAAGMPIEQINADLAAWFENEPAYGHDFPTIRNMLTMMYGHLAG